MRPHALLVGAVMLAATTTAGSAQGYDWAGGGTCVGHGCFDDRYERPVRHGYRAVRTYEDHEVRPRVRIEERRVYRSHRDDDDWDEDDDLD